MLLKWILQKQECVAWVLNPGMRSYYSRHMSLCDVNLVNVYKGFLCEVGFSGLSLTYVSRKSETVCKNMN
jgi:hypothetical protein